LELTATQHAQTLTTVDGTLRENVEMKSKASLTMIVVMAIAGFSYAATPQKSDDPEVAELKRTVTELKQRVTTLEARVNDMSTAKLRLINGAPHQPNQPNQH
jgi:hypothetical protein